MDALNPAVKTDGQPIYFVSDRPEAYEVWGEISPPEAEALARVIVRHASSRFPEVNFVIDSGWHSHARGLETVSAYIEENWPAWRDEASATTALR